MKYLIIISLFLCAFQAQKPKTEEYYASVDITSSKQPHHDYILVILDKYGFLNDNGIKTYSFDVSYLTTHGGNKVALIKVQGQKKDVIWIYHGCKTCAIQETKFVFQDDNFEQILGYPKFVLKR